MSITTIQGIILVLSNLPALAVAIKYYWWGRFIIPLICLGVLFFSPAYHTCDTWSHECLFDRYGLLHHADFWFAQMLVSISMLNLIHWRSPNPKIAHPINIPGLQTAFIFFLAVLNSIIISITGASTIGQFVITAVSISIVGVYWIIYAIVYQSFPSYNYDHMLISVSLSGTSLLLFNFQNAVPGFYWAIHSCWHMMGLCGAWYWASVMPIYPDWLNMGESISVTPVDPWKNPKIQPNSDLVIGKLVKIY